MDPNVGAMIIVEKYRPRISLISFSEEYSPSQCRSMVSMLVSSMQVCAASFKQTLDAWQMFISSRVIQHCHLNAFVG